MECVSRTIQSSCFWEEAVVEGWQDARAAGAHLVLLCVNPLLLASGCVSAAVFMTVRFQALFRRT